MARKKKSGNNNHELFPTRDAVRYGEEEHQQNLFIPKILHSAGLETLHKDENYYRAFEIVSKWAKLDSDGKLETRTEKSLYSSFIGEFFGEALGYVRFAEGKDVWNIEPEYRVNGQTADIALGFFPQDSKAPHVVVELKGPKTNLDKDRSAGRNPIQQCWDYLNELPECPWGIVSNYVSFRLYHREKTPRVYQLFTLQELTDETLFARFYYLFQRDGLLSTRDRKSRALKLLEENTQRQEEVGDVLYTAYDSNRRQLILHLMKTREKTTEAALRVAQKLIDRIIFIAFCEDRALLPQNVIDKAYSRVPPFTKATNPRWENFKALFTSVDEGNPDANIAAYNGNLFKRDIEVDELDLDDKFTDFFKEVGKYDFRNEVGVEVLGHLFEKSIRDIEEIKLGGLFGETYDESPAPKMSKVAERKRRGIYYTPRNFTEFIVRNTVGRVLEERFNRLAAEHKLHRVEAEKSDSNRKYLQYFQECFEILKELKVVDPACGSGAFLIAAYDHLDSYYQTVIASLAHHGNESADQLTAKIPDLILSHNLHGVDLSPEAVEISQLSLWIRSAREGHTLADLSRNIVCGNSLVDDPEIDPKALNWMTAFPSVFERDNPGFDCVIGNPPWERMKLQEREFFDAVSPEIATAVSAARRRELIKKLKKEDPKIHQQYQAKKDEAERLLTYVRQSDRYPLTGKGDINTYSVFAELATSVVSSFGRIGLLVPSGIATDHTTKEFFSQLMESERLVALYDFENRRKIFEDVDGRFKFCILLICGVKLKSMLSDFAFFIHRLQDLRETKRHISLTASDIKLLNPNTNTCPIFRSNRDAEITKAIYKRVPVLIDHRRKEGGNPWGIRFHTMFHQTNDAELFTTAEELKKKRYRLEGNRWVKGKKTYLPLYEAKMIQMYDHRAASIRIDEKNWMRQGQTVSTSSVEHMNPEFVAIPRWWVEESNVKKSLSDYTPRFLVGFKDITSPTNQRTMIASFIPCSAVTNHFPLLLNSQVAMLQACLLANLNSIIFDFITRQKIGGVTLNFFIVEQLPAFHPDRYENNCPWSKSSTLREWISERVLKLTCTSNDMIPLAEAAGFKEKVHNWDERERAELMAELDAAFFLLYEIEREDVEYILSTFQGLAAEDDMFGSKGIATRVLQHYDNLSSMT